MFCLTVHRTHMSSRLKEALIGKTAGETSAEFEQMIIQELVEKPQVVNLFFALASLLFKL